MALILENKLIGPDCYLLTLSGAAGGKPGQFYMLRPGSAADPLLPRPFSLFDAEGDTARICYRVVGRGTDMLSRRRPGETVETTGPLGNGYPLCEGEAVLIGGGLGAAPLYYLSRALKAKGVRVALYLGFSGEPFLQTAFEEVTDEMHTNIGGYITDDVDFSRGATYYACGPAPMMQAAAKKALPLGAKLYVTLESRMACGVGACLCCTCKTSSGNKRVCKDGPVFDAREVYDV